MARVFISAVWMLGEIFRRASPLPRVPETTVAHVSGRHKASGRNRPSRLIASSFATVNVHAFTDSIWVENAGRWLPALRNPQRHPKRSYGAHEGIEGSWRICRICP